MTTAEATGLQTGKNFYQIHHENEQLKKKHGESSYQVAAAKENIEKIVKKAKNSTVVREKAKKDPMKNVENALHQKLDEILAENFDSKTAEKIKEAMGKLARQGSDNKSVQQELAAANQ